MRRLFWAIQLVALLVSLLSVASAPAAPAVKTVTPGVLTVAIDNDMPFCKDENGSLIGVDGEIMTEIGKSLGLKVKPVVMEWAAEIASVQSGRVDTNICGMAYTAEREKVVNLTHPAYFQVTEFTQLKSSSIQSLED